MAKDNDEKQPIIIIKKVKKVEGGHHGGAWKVAYADFVTAMMAFFLLLWLLSVTTDEQKAMLASYFAPTDPRIAESVSGAGGVMGGTTMSQDGAMNNTTSEISEEHAPMDDGQGGETAGEDEAAENAALDREDDKAFAEAEEKIKQAIEEDPELKALADSLIMDMTPEGLRIQIIDREGKPMFELGKATPLPAAIKLLGLVTKAVQEMPNKISIRGHTDSRPYGKGAEYTNWELSSDRANASRRVMLDAGLDIVQVENVQGKADREHLVTNDPESPRNRRISIILLKQSLVKGLQKKVEKKTKKQIDALPQPKKREPGVIYFP